MTHIAKRVAQIASLVSAIFVAHDVTAQVQTYILESEFNKPENVTNIDVRTFDSVAVSNDPGFVEITTPPLTLAPNPGSLLPPLTITSSSTSQVYVGGYSGGFAQNYYLSRDFNGSQTFITFAGTGVSAIGFVYGSTEFPGSAFSVTAFGDSNFNNPLSTVNFTIGATSLQTGFVGFASNSQIKSVLFKNEDGATHFNLLQVSVGNALPVPEPSAYAMFGAGLALFGMIGRRRSRKS